MLYGVATRRWDEVQRREDELEGECFDVVFVQQTLLPAGRRVRRVVAANYSTMSPSHRWFFTFHRIRSLPQNVHLIIMCKYDRLRWHRIAVWPFVSYCALARAAVLRVNHIYRWHQCARVRASTSSVRFRSVRSQEKSIGEDIGLCYARNVAWRHSSTFSSIWLLIGPVEPVVMQQ